MPTEGHYVSGGDKCSTGTQSRARARGCRGRALLCRDAGEALSERVTAEPSADGRDKPWRPRGEEHPWQRGQRGKGSGAGVLPWPRNSKKAGATEME